MEAVGVEEGKISGAMYPGVPYFENLDCCRQKKQAGKCFGMKGDSMKIKNTPE
jgi:hypothetical protein